eukprot:scaffold8995_cov120-Isochrysis_galbana.AAC.11
MISQGRVKWVGDWVGGWGMGTFIRHKAKEGLSVTAGAPQCNAVDACRRYGLPARVASAFAGYSPAVATVVPGEHDIKSIPVLPRSPPDWPSAGQVSYRAQSAVLSKMVDSKK